MNKGLSLFISSFVVMILLSACHPDQEALYTDAELDVLSAGSNSDLYYKTTFVDCSDRDTIINDQDIEGYSDKQSYEPGETARFYIHCRTSEFTAEVYRFGKDVVKISEERGIPGKVQHYACYSYSWGCRWENNYNLTIPQDYETGMYALRIVNTNGAFFWITFIVKPKPSNRNDILVLASTNTWQAYNWWGGASFYKNQVNGDVPSSLNVSFFRPNPAADPSHEGQFSHLASGERFMLEWLEVHGYPYDMVCDKDLHNDPLLLGRYKVLIIQVHPEYWTRSMMDFLKFYLDNGGNLMYLGGNGLHWKVVYNTEHNILEVRRNRELHHYVPLPGGLWKQLDFSESTLLGVRYDSRGFNTFAPYEAYDPDHWIMANTGLKKGDVFSSECFGCAGGSGHETDKIDEDSPPVDTLAIGMNADGGGAHMIYYQRAGGGQVFSVGSLTFTRTILKDEAASQITHNVLRRFTK